MVHVNKKYLDDALRRAVWERFRKTISSAQSHDAFLRILETILTPSERTMIEKRLAILHLVDHGTRFRKIQQMLDASPATISFVKAGLKRRPAQKRGHTSTGKRGERKKSSPATYSGKNRWRFLDAR